VEVLLLRLLDAGEAVAVGPDRADELRRERPVRVAAAVLGGDRDAREVELADGLALASLDLAGEVDEALAPVGELAEELVERHAERGGEAVGRGRGVRDLLGVGGDRGGVLGHGQLAAVAVHDRAAPGGDHDLLDLLLGGAAAEAVALDPDEPGGAEAGEDEEDEEEPEEQTDAPLEQGHPAREPGPVLLRRGPRRPVSPSAWGSARSGWARSAWEWSWWASLPAAGRWSRGRS
jgi:hypothetical protein